MPMVEVDREFARYFHLEERLRQVDDLQKILNNTLTMAKQMSAISWADLPVVGVQARERVLPAVTLHQALVGGRRETDARYVSAIEESAGKLYDDYKVWGGALNFRTEAAARTHINCMIRHMLPLSDELLFGPSGPGKTIICPELILSNVGDNTKIPPGPEAKTTLSITGRADYTQIHISNWETLGEDEQGFLIEDLQAIAVVKGDGSSFPESARVCLSIIEAKSVTSSGDDLVSHLPQAIVEALVLSTRSQAKSFTPSTVPFILTNGFEWIFGFLNEMDSDMAENTRWECCRTAPFVIPSYGLKAGEEDERREETKAALRFVLELLLHWTCADRDVIKQNAL